MKKHILFFALLFSIIVISSCETGNPVGNGGVDEIIPLRVGNTWVNSLTHYDSNGVVAAASVESAWVSQDTIVDGQEYFLISSAFEDSTGAPYPERSYYLARNTPLGYNERDLTLHVESRVYGYPIQIKDPMVVKGNEAVTVPAGTFNCIVYKFVAGLYRTDSVYQILYGQAYVCPNVGIIKKEFLYPKNDLNFRSIATRIILK